MFSTFGVREGLFYDMLPPAERSQDGLICAAQTLNGLLSRSARHAEELIAWTDRLARIVHLRETEKTAGCAMPPACCRISAGACIPTIAARKR